MDKFIAWGVDSCSDDGHSLLGRYWCFDNSHQTIPPHLEGCKVALYKTRQLAKEGAESARGGSMAYSPFPKARAIKVEVTIKEATNGHKNRRQC